MKSLLRTEWLKIKHYRAFWWMAGITALSYPGINYIFYRFYSEIMTRGGNAAEMVKMMVGNPFTFPEVWHTVAFFSTVFVFIPAIVVIMFITNEYTYKTHRQNIIDGWSRKQFLTSKMIDVFIIALLVTALYAIVALVIGFVNIGDSTGSRWDQTKYIWLFFLQTYAQLSLAFLVAFLARKAFIALGIFIFYYVILENFLVGFAKWKANDIGEFLPLEISDRLIPVPAFFGKIDINRYNAALAEVNPHIIYTFLLIGLTWFLCYRINNKRDL
ncbi:MAG TPA: ABC transporter permease [Flavisolibacter sp.]|nr:ABC transporter permease [Flavisolibacter sp.]